MTINQVAPSHHVPTSLLIAKLFAPTLVVGYQLSRSLGFWTLPKAGFEKQHKAGQIYIYIYLYIHSYIVMWGRSATLLTIVLVRLLDGSRSKFFPTQTNRCVSLADFSPGGFRTGSANSSKKLKSLTFQRLKPSAGAANLEVPKVNRQKVGWQFSSPIWPIDSQDCHHSNPLNLGPIFAKSQCWTCLLAKTCRNSEFLSKILLLRWYWSFYFSLN